MTLDEAIEAAIKFTPPLPAAQPKYSKPPKSDRTKFVPPPKLVNN
jgi:hypothetical protein